MVGSFLLEDPPSTCARSRAEPRSPSSASSVTIAVTFCALRRSTITLSQWPWCIVDRVAALCRQATLSNNVLTLNSAVLPPHSRTQQASTGQTRHSLAPPRLAACCQARLPYITLTTHARDELRPAVPLNRTSPASTAFLPSRREGEPRPAYTPPFACLARVDLSEQ